MQKGSRKGFTWIEFLIITIIVATLVALFAVCSSNGKSKAPAATPTPTPKSFYIE